MPFCLKLTKIWHYIRTCTKTCMAICFRKTSVYRNDLYISVCNSGNIVSVFFMFSAISKAWNSSFQKVMAFCRNISVKKVMKLLAFIFEQPSYYPEVLWTIWCAIASCNSASGSQQHLGVIVWLYITKHAWNYAFITQPINDIILFENC